MTKNRSSDNILAMDRKVLLEKITYWLGYFKGASNILRSAGDIDPLSLSGDFEDITRDLGVIRQGLTEILQEIDNQDKETDKQE